MGAAVGLKAELETAKAAEAFKTAEGAVPRCALEKVRESLKRS
jgi:hypothetical protein